MPVGVTIHTEKVGQLNLCKVKWQSVPSLSYSSKHTGYICSVKGPQEEDNKYNESQPFNHQP